MSYCFLRRQREKNKVQAMEHLRQGNINSKSKFSKVCGCDICYGSRVDKSL